MNRFIHFMSLVFCSSNLMASVLTWSSPSTLSTSMVDASDPRIVMDPAGNAAAAWLEDGVVYASYQSVNMSWGTSTALSNPSASDVRLGVDESGNVTAVWLESGVVKSATLPAGGSWSVATALSSSGASSPVISVRSNGDIVAAWVRSGFIESSTQLSGGSWSLVNILSAADSSHPDISVGANGTAVAIWHTSAAGGNVIVSAVKTMGGAWGTAKQVVTVPIAYELDYPKVSVDSDGNADALCYRYQIVDGEYINVAVFAASLPLNAAGWTAIPTQLTLPGIGDPANFQATIVHDHNGNAVASWSISYDESTFSLESAYKRRGAAWGDATQLIQSDYSYEIDVSANSLSDAVGIYMDFDGVNTTVQSVEANVGGIFNTVEWAAPIAVSSSGNNGYPKAASVFVSGQIIASAIWLNSDGTTTSVQASTGSRDTIAPPSNLAVVQDNSDFGIFNDYFNTITWDASTDPSTAFYLIYKNGILFESVNLAGNYPPVDHNVDPNGSDTYGVAAVDNAGLQSEIVTITYP